METPPSARCGIRELPGMCWRPGDPNKHLGPPVDGIATWSRLFMTRCHLESQDGPWEYGGGPPPGRGDDDVWCPDCLMWAGIAFDVIREDPPS